MRLFLPVFSFFVLMVTAASLEARTETIAAVVNDNAISMSDVNDRMKLIIASSGLPNTAEIRKKLLGQVLGSLIEEELKLQEARRLGIEISQSEIDNGFLSIAQQNNFEGDQFKAMLQKGGINISTMENQIRAQIAWTKIVQGEMRPRIVISDRDIDNVIERLQGNKGSQEYLVAEVYLPVDEAKKENDVRQLAARLVNEIKSGKTSFYKIAQQFSKAAGASNGGDLGWVQKGQLPEELENAVQKMSKETVSQPIRSRTGFHIVFLRDKRDISDETIPSRDQIMSDLGVQRLERMQRRYYLDLKSSAFIENRLES